MKEQFDVSISRDRSCCTSAATLETWNTTGSLRRGRDLQGQRRRNCDVQRNRRFHTSITRRLRFQRKELSCLDIGSEGTIIPRLFSVSESLGKPPLPIAGRKSAAIYDSSWISIRHRAKPFQVAERFSRGSSSLAIF